MPIGEWTLPRLTAAISDLVSNASYMTRAEEVGLRMRDDGGVAAAARIVRNLIGVPEARAS
jgi:hypothetical protein